MLNLNFNLGFYLLWSGVSSRGAEQSKADSPREKFRFNTEMVDSNKYTNLCCRTFLDSTKAPMLESKYFSQNFEQSFSFHCDSTWWSLKGFSQNSLDPNGEIKTFIFKTRIKKKRFFPFVSKAVKLLFTINKNWIHKYNLIVHSHFYHLINTGPKGTDTKDSN